MRGWRKFNLIKIHYELQYKNDFNYVSSTSRYLFYGFFYVDAFVQEIVADFETLIHSPFLALVTLRHSSSLKTFTPWLPSLDPDVFALQTDRERERAGGSESKLWTNSLYDFVLIWAVRASDKTKSPSISVRHICLEFGLCCIIMFLTNVDRLIADRRCIQTFCHGVKVLDGWQHVNKSAVV